MVAKKKLTVERQEEIRKKMLAFRLEAEEGNKSTFIRMTENEGFKIGRRQWPNDHGFNAAHGKFALTINKVLPIVLDIAGTQEENPLDYKVRNVKGGTRIIASILSSMAKNVMDKSMGREEASRSFESGVTTARGFINIDIDYTNDPLNGDFKIEELDPFTVLPDPTCRTYDYNAEKGGAKYVIIDRWEDKEKMIAKYPDAELKDASFNLTQQTLFGRFRGIMSSVFGGGYDPYLKDDYRNYDDNQEDQDSHITKQKNNFRVSTYWWKEWKKGLYVQKIDDPLNYLALTDTKDMADAKRLAKEDPNLKIIDKDRDENPLTIPVLNKTRMVGDKFLEHIPDPYDGMNLYLINRFAPYFDHGYEYPPVENLIGPQKLINYSFSTLVNLVKNLANTGWLVWGGSEKKKEELEDSGGVDGKIWDVKDFGGRMEKIEPNTYPAAYERVTEISNQNMREISQTQLVVPRRGRPESGEAKKVDEIRQARTKGTIFRNWNQTNILVGRVLVELMRNTEVFSDEEVMAIVDEEDLLDPEIMDQAKGIVINQIRQRGGQIPEAPQQPNPIRARNAEPEMQAQMLEAFQKEMAQFEQFVEQVEQAAVPIAKEIILKLLRQMQQGRYGIKVDTSPMAPTLRAMRRLEALELDKQLIEGGRAGISRKKLIEISDVQDAEEIIAEVPEQVQGAA